MVNALCELYGDKIELDLDGESHTFYNFPTLVQLFANRADMEDELKERKFGYRAAWIVKAVEKLTEIGGRSWLQELKYKPYSEASKALIDNFTGIGKKVSFMCVDVC
jgi:3-methyladenine DNA glycosylase/8-oxoguanine DNA glycosylase